MTRQLDFSDGFTTAATPTQGNLQSNALKVFADDAAFVTDKGSAATAGDMYFDSTLEVYKVHDGSNFLVYEHQNRAKYTSAVQNASVVNSVGSSAMTINLVDALGATPTVITPVRIPFRNATLATGTYAIVEASSAISIVIPSGATLGHKNATNETIFVYAINNAGTIELAVSNVNTFNESSRHTTTTIGGASDARDLLFSTTFRSNIAVRLIGKLISNQGTAGAWDLVATTNAPVVKTVQENPVFAKYNLTASTANASFANNTQEVIDFDSKIIDTHDAVTTGASWIFTAPVQGTYEVSAAIFWGSADWDIGNSSSIFISGQRAGQYTALTTGTVGGIPTQGTGFVVDMAEGATFNTSALQTTGDAVSLLTDRGFVLIKRIGGL